MSQLNHFTILPRQERISPEVCPRSGYKFVLLNSCAYFSIKKKKKKKSCNIFPQQISIAWKSLLSLREVAGIWEQTNRSVTSTLRQNFKSGNILLNSCRTLSMVICHCESSNLAASLSDDSIQVNAKTKVSKFKKKNVKTVEQNTTKISYMHWLLLYLVSSTRWSSQRRNQMNMTKAWTRMSIAEEIPQGLFFFLKLVTCILQH